MAEISEILTKLIERTDQGKVLWKPTADEQTFVAAVGDNAVMILRTGHPVLKVLDKAGRELDVLDGNRSSEWRERLWDLHAKARRVALSVDDQLDQLLKELEVEA